MHCMVIKLAIKYTWYTPNPHLVISTLYLLSGMSRLDTVRDMFSVPSTKWLEKRLAVNLLSTTPTSSVILWILFGFNSTSCTVMLSLTVWSVRIEKDTLSSSWSPASANGERERTVSVVLENWSAKESCRNEINGVTAINNWFYIIQITVRSL